MQKLNRVLFLLMLLLAVKKLQAQTVSGAASATIGPVLGQITSCQGAQSQGQEVQFFTLTAIDLTGDADIQASSGFLVSVNESSGFAEDIKVSPLKGLVLDTVWVRIGPTAPVGNVVGFITITSPGLTPQTINVNGSVLPMPTAIAEPNITVLNGATIPRLYFEGTGNTYIWTVDNPNIGLPSNGADSLPTFRAINNSNAPVTATVTVTPAQAAMAYVTIKGANAVTVINTILNTIDTTFVSRGNKPTAATLSADGTELYVLNQTSQTIAVYNTATNKLERLLDFPQTPLPGIWAYQITVNKANTELYIMNFGTADVFAINAQTGALLYDGDVGIIPSEMALSPSGNQYYVGSNKFAQQGQVNIYNTSNNNLIGQVTVPPFFGDPKLPPTYTYLDMVFTPDSSKLYIGNATAITEINTVSQRVVGTLPVGTSGNVATATCMAISPDGKKLYVLVSDQGGNEIQVFSTVTNEPDKTIIPLDNSVPVGFGMCISPDGKYLYVSNTANNTVTVIDANLLKTVAVIPVGQNPQISAFCVKPGGCYGDPISFTITINPAPAPAIVITPDSLGAMTTTYGTPSAAESFTISGTLLRAAIQLTAPKGFEISLDGATFSSTLTINASGALPPTTVYVRLAAADITGYYTGYISLVSPGAGNANVFIAKSTVTPAPLTITADNKVKAFGALNPVLTATYSGFENDDTPASLVYPVVLATTALTNSPVGRYPITVGGAYSLNYNFTYIPGILTITPDVIIPNTFTPNGDGINDTWNIQKINDYPNCSVQVFNRNGQLVYNSIGYSVAWDGAYKGSPLPAGTYYYLINLNAGVPLLSGFVAILR